MKKRISWLMIIALAVLSYQCRERVSFDPDDIEDRPITEGDIFYNADLKPYELNNQYKGVEFTFSTTNVDSLIFERFIGDSLVVSFTIPDTSSIFVDTFNIQSFEYSYKIKAKHKFTVSDALPVKRIEFEKPELISVNLNEIKLFGSSLKLAYKTKFVDSVDVIIQQINPTVQYDKIIDFTFKPISASNSNSYTFDNIIDTLFFNNTFKIKTKFLNEIDSLTIEYNPVILSSLESSSNYKINKFSFYWNYMNDIKAPYTTDLFDFHVKKLESTISTEFFSIYPIIKTESSKIIFDDTSGTPINSNFKYKIQISNTLSNDTITYESNNIKIDYTYPAVTDVFFNFYPVYNEHINFRLNKNPSDFLTSLILMGEINDVKFEKNQRFNTQSINLFNKSDLIDFFDELKTLNHGTAKFSYRSGDFTSPIIKYNKEFDHISIDDSENLEFVQHGLVPPKSQYVYRAKSLTINNLTLYPPNSQVTPSHNHRRLILDSYLTRNETYDVHDFIYKRKTNPNSYIIIQDPTQQNRIEYFHIISDQIFDEDVNGFYSLNNDSIFYFEKNLGVYTNNEKWDVSEFENIKYIGVDNYNILYLKDHTLFEYNLKNKSERNVYNFPNFINAIRRQNKTIFSGIFNNDLYIFNIENGVELIQEFSSDLSHIDENKFYCIVKANYLGAAESTIENRFILLSETNTPYKFRYQFDFNGLSIDTIKYASLINGIESIYLSHFIYNLDYKLKKQLLSIQYEKVPN